ncbi:Gfo/Idh/MocA family protein [Alkalicoccus urumqiensis]|uniref:Oxidoreductase n=1 Tax=Alkalicoccus urumqiensis TaxID=1548213 RepID=A0A2P6MJS6_ALKUR|nr:Gfo/Idh/MocA family oxidoreductase [Alkalicoccus urumqiensis]PRO66540.1 oxidoreductase [Alkalicoccus urumqiensis]
MTLRIGIVGTGGFAAVHRDRLEKEPGVEIVSVCGTSREKAERFSEGRAEAFSSAEAMVENSRLDGVYICVPPMSHGPVEHLLLDHSIPFFVEKPLHAGMEIPEEIAARVRETGLLTSVGYHFRYEEAAQSWKEAVLQQETAVVSGEWSGDRPGVSWWKDQTRSGGQFVEQTTHLVDLIRWTFGEAASIRASSTRRVHTEADSTVQDAQLVELTMENGLLVSLRSTCALPEGVGRVGITAGTDGGLIDWEPNRMQWTKKEGVTTTVSKEDPYTLETRAFLQALRTGDRTLIQSDYEDARKTQRITTAAALSAAEDRRVFLS